MSNWANLSTDLLPPILQDFVKLIGLYATMQMVQRLGGLRVYIPANPPLDHKLAQLIGHENLLKLSKEYGTGERVMLPKAYHALLAIRNKKILSEYGPKSIRTLAVEHQLTERSVLRIVATASPAHIKNQSSLF